VKKQFTIKDLAEALNLHHTTVSRALRNHPDVNVKTREAVLKAVEKYNYVPNSFARNLRNAQSRTLVVMLPSVKNHFFSEVLGVISDMAVQSAYSVMICQSNEDDRVESQNIRVMLENRVAGLIASVADVRRNQELFIQLEQQGIPVVLFDRFYEGNALTRVKIDNFQGAYDATAYLVAAGRKKIGFYRGPMGNPVFDERFRGYRKALEDHGTGFKKEWVFQGGLSVDDGENLVKDWELTGRPVDGVLCAVDMVALGIINGARDSGLRIPGDLSLIGFDNEPAGRLIRPALTTVAQPVEEVGRTAFELLLGKMEGHNSRGKTVDREAQVLPEIKLNMELIKRGSA
jgi:DNA-binding LacI/PurR family transcriptional regulator